MITKPCEKCGKIIEGYTIKQVNYMIDQHKLVHKYNKEKIKEKTPPPKDIEVIDETKEAKADLMKDDPDTKMER